MDVLMGLLIAFFFGLVFPVASMVLAVKLYQLQKRLKLRETENQDLKDALKTLAKNAEPLWKYKDIEDAKKEALDILAKADSEANKTRGSAHEFLRSMKEKADSYLAKTNLECDELKKAATELSKTTKDKAEEILAKAHRQADEITTLAKERAREIAGSAFEAKEKADLFEQKVRAMKNVIEGYGDEYLIATKTLLDDLAEEFSHKQGGVELKNARQLTRALVSSGRAATCDYAEAYRRETAIRFVLDAFNGKVDSALSKVKHDNYGKLEQEIKDAFGLVNGHGQAFRNARITEEYLSARLSELRWAVITQELRRQEQEEQRRIKEEMREEEKARREYERAIQEAEKEEKMLQKAMAEARKHLAQASEEQKKMYEDQIAELQAKFEEAEARNQRAISMAQQTRRGHVYVISNVGSFGENIYKIGLTRRLEPLDRIKELGDASVPFDFDVHAMIYAEDAPTLEKELHKHFEEHQVNKVNYRKEFFSVSLKDIKSAVAGREIETHWTMLAEAREYRESLAISSPHG